MKEKSVNQPMEDAAWFSVDLPLSREDLYGFILQLERLFRLNPHLDIKSWQEEKPGQIYAGKLIQIDVLNEMTGLRQNMNLCVSVSDDQQEKSFTLTYDSSLKQATVFTVQGLTPTTSKLVVKDRYRTDISAAEREARLSEVDRSLVPWGESIHTHFARRSRWGWLPFYNAFWDKLWIGMTPRQRRVSRLILWTTVLEFVIFLFVFVIYWLELMRGRF